MLLHEKLRLQRKVNKLTLKQAQASSRKERVTKQIERIQKMYSKREANLDAQAKRMQNYAGLQFKNFFGLASNMINTNPMGYLNGGLNNMGVMQTMHQGFESGGLKSEIFGSAKEVFDFMQQYKTGIGPDGKTCYVLADAKPGEDTHYTQNDIDAAQAQAGSTNLEEMMKEANKLQSAAYNQYQMNQSYCANATSNYENNISIWLEYEKAQLEAEQDEALLPLQEQETEWDMESTSAEAQLADARARLDSIKQALSEGIKDSAPTFGLG